MRVIGEHIEDCVLILPNLPKQPIEPHLSGEQALRETMLIDARGLWAPRGSTDAAHARGLCARVCWGSTSTFAMARELRSRRLRLAPLLQPGMVSPPIACARPLAPQMAWRARERSYC